MDFLINEWNWKFHVRDDGVHCNARSLQPDTDTDEDFVRRQALGGLEYCKRLHSKTRFATNSQDPQFQRAADRQEPLETALQLLHVASPATVLTLGLASPQGMEWQLVNGHSAVQLEREAEPNLNPSIKAWKAITSNRFFIGRFGVFVNHRDAVGKGPSKPFTREEAYGLWETSGTMGTGDWKDFFAQCFGPINVTLPSQSTVVSMQTSVWPGYLPPFLTIDAAPGRTPTGPLFPQGAYSIVMRTNTDELVKTRVRWVGGIYKMKFGHTQRLLVVFDWADGSSSVGASQTGNWATDPPMPHGRIAFERECAARDAKPVLLVFRRVEHGRVYR